MSRSAPVIARHLATINLWREASGAIHVTFAEAEGVRAELGESGAPLGLCAMNALRAAIELQSPGCRHEPYQGRCAHCDVPFRNGKPVEAA